MTSINNQEDFLKALDDNPQWREAVRARILGDELLQLPVRFDAFVEQMTAFVERMTDFVAEQKQINAELTGFVEHQKQVNAELTGFVEHQKEVNADLTGFVEHQKQVNAELTGFVEHQKQVNADLTGFVERQKEVNADLTGFVEHQKQVNAELTGFVEHQKQVNADLTGFVERQEQVNADLTGFVERQEQVNAELTGFVERQKEVNADLTGFVEHQKQVNAELTGFVEHQKQVNAEQGQFNAHAIRRFENIEGRLGNLEGSDYERKVRYRVMSRAHSRLGLEDPYLALTQNDPQSPRLSSSIGLALRNGFISPEESEDLHDTDIIISDRNNRHVTAEVSMNVDRGDIDRAKRRATILGAVTGGIVAPVIVTPEMSDEQRAWAEAAGVTAFVVPYQ